MKRSEQLAAMLEKALAEESAREDKYGEEPVADGTVIAWTSQFMKGSKKYLYAAIRSDGRWYTTGPNTPKAYAWGDLCEWWDGQYKIKHLRVLS